MESEHRLIEALHRRRCEAELRAIFSPRWMPPKIILGRGLNAACGSAPTKDGHRPAAKASVTKIRRKRSNISWYRRTAPEAATAPPGPYSRYRLLLIEVQADLRQTRSLVVVTGDQAHANDPTTFTANVPYGQLVPMTRAAATLTA